MNSHEPVNQHKSPNGFESLELPTTIEALVHAQNNHDSLAYTACFADQAVVYDESKTLRGKAEIRQWIEDSNQKYQSVIRPVGYERSSTEELLKARVSGNFPGSPAVLHFHLTMQDGLINFLKITG